MEKTRTVAAAAAPMALAADDTADMTRIVHTGTVHVTAAPGDAFPLFTAPGEKVWVPGWDPVFVGDGDGLRRGSVWLTNDGEDRTVWLVVDYDPDKLHARYARVTPASRAGTVEVTARPDGSGGTRVEVTYDLTALSADGNEMLADFNNDYFAKMMREWERLIREADIEYPLSFTHLPDRAAGT
jgi:hypothetical protein